MTNQYLWSAAFALLTTPLGAQQQGPAAQSPELTAGSAPHRHIECELPPNLEDSVPQVWPGGIVPYRFDANVNIANRTVMYSAMDQWMLNGGFGPDVTFLPYDPNTHSAYLHIQDDTGNSASQVGYVPGQTTIRIFNWDIFGTVVHELGHALAFPHEQSRPDRDTYVTINTANIVPMYLSQFSIRTWHPAWSATPYDYGSVMHYSECAFSNCTFCGGIFGCETIDAMGNAIGQRLGASGTDLAEMMLIYGQRTSPIRFARPGGVVSVGTLAFPIAHSDFLNVVPPGSTVYMEPGTYNRLSSTGEVRLSTGMTLRGSGPNVRING